MTMVADDYEPPCIFVLAGIGLYCGLRTHEPFVCFISIVAGACALLAGIHRWLDLRERERERARRERLK